MNKFVVLFLVFVVARTAETLPEPFEPPASAFFSKDDKFAQPRQVVAPRLLWPIEKNRAASVEIGDVVVLVQLDKDGRPKRLSVLSSTDELFTREALSALRKARWMGRGSDVCFYFHAHFDLAELSEEEPNQSPDPTAPSGRGSA